MNGSADDRRPVPAGSTAVGSLRRRRRRTWRLVAAAVLGTLLVAGAAGTGLYLKLSGNIDGVDISGGGRPEDDDNGSLDLLVLGSDARGAHDPEDGPPARADTAMVVHLHRDRAGATVVSIPRDALLPRPACTDADGRRTPAVARAMFNEAYALGGPVCAVRTVEAVTGIRMDHYLEIDFEGFAGLVDTLGGVTVTLTEPLRDPDSKLDLPAGTHHLDGEQALALVRTRKAVGDGSDLARIDLQHIFLEALAERISGLDLWSSPKRLYELASAATSAVTTDSDLASVAGLAGLGRTLRGLGPQDLDLITLPVTADPMEPNRVVPLEPQAGQVWDALREDRPVPASALRGSVAEREPSPEVSAVPQGRDGGE
ncbi:LCP family protein [Streptomyces aidingensis]|uniref:Cell envelope-related function transcriptional attenuator common domain-containing protein n=1 Tax=Streptomyces aidingensis TaxID=910347 RepID=A0A1I1T416_9ACTN|nr:LCP family protein [Streptomyces aidingensis]SFD50993.1 cell envelope-related function transcriptional attenuator common domain-containing protein [Streptomyces aidingensis]